MTHNTLLESQKMLSELRPGMRRSNLKTQCFAMDSEVVIKLKEMGYYTKDNVVSQAALDHFKDTSGMPTVYERLQDVKAKQENATDWSALDCWVQNAQRTMIFFLDNYHIGYVDTVFLDDAGILQVTIECITGDDHDGKWKEQLETLRTVGITLKERMHTSRYYLPATGENITGLRRILVPDTQNITMNFTVENNVIETITLEINPPALNKFMTDAMLFNDESTVQKYDEFLTEEDCAAITDSLKSMMFAYANSDTSINKLLIGRLMETHCALISHVLDVNTTTRQTIDERFKNEKEIAAQYRELDKALGESVNIETLSAAVVSLNRQIHSYISENIGMCVRDCKIYPSSYGYIGATLRFPRASRLDKSQWENHEGLPLASAANRNKLLDFCKAHDIRVLNMNIAYNTQIQNFVIESLNVQIMNINKLLPITL